MKTTVEFLNAVKTKHNLPSDGRLAIMLGLTRASISRFQQGKDFLGDDTAMKVADLLDIDPAYIVACVHAERAKPAKEKALWNRIAALSSGIAATALLAVILSAGLANLPSSTGAAYKAISVENTSSGIYIMRNFDALEWAVLGLFFIACLLAIPRHNSPKN